MRITQTRLAGAYVIEVEPIPDDRGLFARSFCMNEFAEHGLVSDYVQSNLSVGIKAGTLRGLHYQNPPHAEVKVIRCVRGALYDVIVDLRPESATYRDWFGVELTQDNHSALYVPAGFGHGFMTLKDDSEANYMVSAFYTPGAEGGLRWDDPAIGIDWPMAPTVISEKDAGWPDLGE